MLSLRYVYALIADFFFFRCYFLRYLLPSWRVAYAVDADADAAY